MTMITSDNLSRICSLPRPHVYHTPDFCADVLDIPSLSNARVSIVEHLQEPRRPWHEYLLLSVINNNDGLDCIWIRCERSRDTTELPYAFKPIACPALDNVQISYDAKKLRNEKDKIIGSLQCGRSLLFVYTLELWRIIQDESSMWSLIGQNCWWYCSVNLYLYKKKFGGTWGDVPKPPKDDKLKLIQEKLGDFDSVTMKVITRYLGEPVSKNELRKLLRIPMAKDENPSNGSPSRLLLEHVGNSTTPSPFASRHRGNSTDSAPLAIPHPGMVISIALGVFCELLLTSPIIHS